MSDDDLLEVLGQSRDPLAVQKHIKKCFEGFKAMEIIAPGKQLNRNFEVMPCLCRMHQVDDLFCIGDRDAGDLDWRDMCVRLKCRPRWGS